MNEIFSYRLDLNVTISYKNSTVTSRNGVVQPFITRKGRELLVSWNGSSYRWTDLTISNKSYPVPVTEFSYTAQINKEPDFEWWVHKVLQKRDRVIGNLKSRC